MNGRKTAGVSGVEKLQEIEGLGSSNFAKDYPIRRVTERGPKEFPARGAPRVATSWPRSNNGCLVVGCTKEGSFGGFGFCFPRGAARKRRRESKCPSREGQAPVRPRCQGRRGLAFIGAQRRPLTEEAGGSGAGKTDHLQRTRFGP